MNGKRNLMKVLVLGVGNVMRSDDGVGMVVARELASDSLPPGVDVVEGGTDGLAFIELVQAANHVVVIDAADIKAPPGTVSVFSPERVRDLCDEAGVSAHEMRILATIRLMNQLGTCPSVSIVAVQPATLDYGIQLSPEVGSALPQALSSVRAEVGRILADSVCD